MAKAKPKGKGGGGIGSIAMNTARAQVGAAEQPIYAQIAAERQANLARARQQMGFAKAAAAILTGIAPRVQDTYSNAANADAGYARGLGDAVQAPINNEVSQNNAFLAKTGAPSSALAKPADVGGTAYGLQGYIPATTLQREGAAFGSAAQMLPSSTLAQGQQAATSALNDMSGIAPLQADLAKTAATLPAVYQKALEGIQNQQYRGAELNLRQQTLNSENAYRRAELGLRQEGLNLTRANDGAKLQQKIAEGFMPDSALSKLYGYIVDANGNPILSKGQKIRVSSSGGSKGSVAGLTPNEVLHWKGVGGGIARVAFNGGTKASPAPKLDYQHALQQELLHGVPKPIAIWSLRKQGYMPGVRGAPQVGATGLDNFGALGAPFGAAAGAAETAAGNTIVGLAKHFIGTPYVYGGESPKGFDCSGFAQYLYGKIGVTIPRTTYTQWTAKNGASVKKGQLQPGDLVFFKGSDSIGGLPGHVGVYIGGGMMIDAPHTGADVRVESVGGFPGYMGARRFS